MLKLDVIGHLGRDAEVKMIGSSNYLCFPVAHTERKKGQESGTTWVNCCKYMNGDVGIQKYLTKGTKVFVRGNMNIKEFKEGNITINLFVTEVELLSPPKRGEYDSGDCDDLP